MNDVRKSALWALVSIPISLIGHYYLVAWLIAEVDNFFFLPFLPAGFAMALLKYFKALPESQWLISVIALTAQYLGYFLLIYSIIKFWKIGEKNKAKEQSEKDPSGP